MAAAHAVLDVIEDEKLCARAQQLGERLQTRLKNIQQKDAGVSDVRGLGSMVAVEFHDAATGAPDAVRVNAIVQAALSKGLLLLTCGLYGNVIRFLYPLTIEDALFDKALDLIEEVIAG